jgi:Uma2 family endonuclease
MTVIDVGHRLFTRADYHKMAEAGLFAPNERVELLKGEIRTMSPAGSLHVSFVSRLLLLFAPLLGNVYQINVQSPIWLSDESEPEPDIVLYRARPDFYAHELPTPADIVLIVEVSDTTLRYDRVEKLPLYAMAGVPEVWIVDVNAPLIEQYHTPVAGIYTYRVIHQHNGIIATTFGETFNANAVLGNGK